MYILLVLLIRSVIALECFATSKRKKGSSSLLNLPLKEGKRKVSFMKSNHNIIKVGLNVKVTNFYT